MESYQTWFGEGPELSVLRMLGLFDRPADAKAIETLRKPPAIRGLTESTANLSPAEWRTILATLRRARMLSGEDPHNPGQLDTHPLVREYFGEQLRSQRTEAWKECNRRLYDYYQALAPRLPNNFREMEPLFLAVICACNAGLFRQALHEVYIPRIQRGDASFAANVLGARGSLLSALASFFEQGRWGSLAQTGVQDQSLTVEDQLLILTQAGLLLTATRGLGASEAGICYERAESLCNNRPLLLYVTLMGQWRYSFMTDKLSATMQVAQRIYSLAKELNDAAPMIGANSALARSVYYLGDFESARQYATRGVQIWRSGVVQNPIEELSAPEVICLCFKAQSEWHLGEIASSQASMTEAISVAKELNDTHALATALFFAAALGHLKRNPTEVEHLASDLIALSTRQNFTNWLAGGKLYLCWVRSVSRNTAQGPLWVEDAERDYRASGSTLGLPYFLAIKAECLHLADLTSKALAAIMDAEALAEKYEERWWCAELHRLRGVFLASIGSDEPQIEASFRAAIRIASVQNSRSLAARAEATYAEYRRQKAGALGGHGFRLPLC
jgi:predicted ATPase